MPTTILFSISTIFRRILHYKKLSINRLTSTFLNQTIRNFMWELQWLIQVGRLKVRTTDRLMKTIGHPDLAGQLAKQTPSFKEDSKMVCFMVLELGCMDQVIITSVNLTMINHTVLENRDKWVKSSQLAIGKMEFSNRSFCEKIMKL